MRLFALLLAGLLLLAGCAAGDAADPFADHGAERGRRRVRRDRADRGGHRPARRGRGPSRIAVFNVDGDGGCGGAAPAAGGTRQRRAGHDDGPRGGRRNGDQSRGRPGHRGDPDRPADRGVAGGAGAGGLPHRSIGELVSALAGRPGRHHDRRRLGHRRSGPPDVDAAGRDGRHRPGAGALPALRRRWRAAAAAAGRSASTPPCPAWSSTRPRSAPVSCGCWPCPGRPGCPGWTPRR